MTSESTHRAFDRFAHDEVTHLVALGLVWTDRHTACELAREALVRAHRDWWKVERLDLPSAWVRKVVIDLAGARRRRQEWHDDGPPAVHADPADTTSDLFWHTVRTLSDRERAAVALRHLEEMPVAAIAELLEIQPGMAKTNLANARARLRAAVATADAGTPDDDRLDAIARQAAARLRAEARAAVAADDALQAFLAEVDAGAVDDHEIETAGPDDGPLTPTAPAPRSRRSRHLVAVAIAVAVAAAAGFAVVNGFGNDVDLAAPTGTGDGPGASGGTGAGSGSMPGAATTAADGSTPATSAQGRAPGTGAPTGEQRTPAVPAMSHTTFDQLPRVLPDPPFDAALTQRLEWDTERDQPLLSQTWVLAAGDGNVDGVVTLTTAPSEQALGDGDPVDVPGWSRGFLRRSADGSVQLDVEAATGGTVQMRAWGIPVADAVTVAATLRLAGEASTEWSAPALEASGWTLVQTDWAYGTATRVLIVGDGAGRPVTQLSVTSGTSVIDLGLPVASATARVVTLADGRTAFATADGSIATLTWTDGWTYSLATRGTIDELVALAGSLHEVDRATWTAASTPITHPDGCAGLLC